MTNLPDAGHGPENQGMPFGELPIQIESAALQSLATFLEYPPDALIVVDEAGTIALVNTQAETLFGYDHGELLGQTVERLLPEQLHAIHMAKRTRYMQAAHTQPMSLNLDLLVGRRKDGSHFPVEISLRPLRMEQTLHVMAAIRDMTVQREIEQEAHAEADERLRAFQLILDHITSGIFLEQGPHLRLLLANRAATALWGAEWPRGQPKEEFFRQYAIQLFTPNGHQLAPDEWGSKLALNTGNPVLRRQLVICRADHTCFPVLVDAIPLGKPSLAFPLAPGDNATACRR